MPLLIATDEAGYGPKLGPLIIVATAWRLECPGGYDSAFEILRTPFCDECCDAVFVDDSKRVFRRHETLAPGKMSVLDVVCRAASNWASLQDPLANFPGWLKETAAADFAALVGEPWFASWGSYSTPSDRRTAKSSARHEALIEHWSSAGARLCGIQARFITATMFNAILNEGKNKADLLTEATCGMAVELINRWGQDDVAVDVFSDRHGGRAFYGAALQHAANGAAMQVVREERQLSEYQLQDCNAQGIDRHIKWSFSVGGDSFAPVAMSSMIAKWLRERAMCSFNQYFFDRMPAGQALRPTAGYPSDADRYLQDIEQAGLRQSFADSVLVRSR